jgi:hypothetical protein
MELSEVRAHAAVVLDEAQQQEAAILTHTIQWESYLTAGVLSDRDVQMIRRFDKRDKFTQAALWEKARAAAGVPGCGVCRALKRRPRALS